MSERSLFFAALDIDDPAERAAYLDRACAGDAALRGQVEQLLQAHQESGLFMERPAVALGVTTDEPIRERPGTIIGPYKLLEQIGEGGFGIVFMAEQTQPLRRKVAVKVLKPGIDTRQVIARFEAERQVLALMNHPHIAHVFDGGETVTGRPYFVMELVRGISITDFCAQNHLSIRERLELFVDVCQAVQHAHQKGIIHRNLKPSNVLVTLHDGTPVVKVIDFGIAKATGQQLTDKTLFTNFAQMIGTPLYMSPEQAALSNVDVDTRSDVYSLGVLLDELLTGTTPFDQERLRTMGYDEIRRIIREEEPPRPSTRISTLARAATTASGDRQSDPKNLVRLMRGELDWIVMKALEKDRDSRYTTANSFALDVQRYLHDEPVLACPPSTGYRLRKFARRNKAALGVSGLVLFFLVLIGGGVGYGVRDRAARHAKLNLEIEHALEDAAKGRDLALMLTDNPYAWEAALTAAASELKRAQGLAAGDETALEPDVRERLQGMETLLNADEADRRFAGRFEEILLEQYEVHMGRTESKKREMAFNSFKEAFQRCYRIVYGVTPVERAASVLQQRPEAMQDILLATLEICLDEHVPKEDRQTRPWLVAVLDAADKGPWRKRAQQAVKASDWKAFEQIFEEAVTARQPQWLLDRLIGKTPLGSPIRLKLLRRFRQAYPGNFWANHSLAGCLHYGHSQPGEAIRYYTAALALRPHNPMACFNLGKALDSTGEPDGAISAYREALDGHPDFAVVHNNLAWILVTCPYVPLRDPVEGVKQAQKAVELAPGNGNWWNTLGAAHYRAGSWKEAVAALEKAGQLRGGDSYDWFFLAMAHWRLGEKDKARHWFERAVQWMDRNMPTGKELGRFRTEAAELLKIEAKKK